MNRVELPASDIRERGRDCYQRRRWLEAFAALSQADQIDKIVPPGATLNRDDSGYIPLPLGDPFLRRRRTA